jgi:hypothetical protein
MTVKFYAVLVVLALVAPGAAGCARAKANAVPDGAPALDVPPPPPRDVEVNESEPPPPMPLPQEPARNTPPRGNRNNPAPAPARPNEPPRTEPPKPETPPVIEPQPKPPEEPAKTPAPTLQTTPAQADVEVERNIRATMTRAGNDLNRIDYRVLNTDARMQYDTAKTFIRQAGDALSRKNLEYARTLADKAATIAAQLRGR